MGFAIPAVAAQGRKNIHFAAPHPEQTRCCTLFLFFRKQDAANVKTSVET